jgi:hypothetical protein
MAKKYNCDKMASAYNYIVNEQVGFLFSKTNSTTCFIHEIYLYDSTICFIHEIYLYEVNPTCVSLRDILKRSWVKS